MMIPAAITKLPSAAADTNSALPCPYGWFSSFGFAAIYKLYSPIKPAITFTILSNASERIDTDEVM